MAVFLSKEEHHGPKKSVPTEHIRSQLTTQHGIWSRGTLPFSSFSFCRKPRRRNTVLSNRPVIQLGRARRGTCHFFFGLDGRVSSKTIGRGGRPLFVGNAVLSKKICGDGVCTFRRLSETSRKWRSHQSSGSTGTRRVPVCRVYTGVRGLRNDAAPSLSRLRTGTTFRKVARGAQQARPSPLHIIRDGEQIHLLRVANEVVPGDLVTFTTGDRIPVDVRLLTAVDLEVDGRSLTGETTACRNGVASCPESAEMVEGMCIAYMGTLVRNGAYVRAPFHTQLII